jgi:putative ABC transport system substrate-binding protein
MRRNPAGDCRKKPSKSGFGPFRIVDLSRYDDPRLSPGAGMRRREFIGLLGGAASWPLKAHAQQPTPVIGFLNTGSLGPIARSVEAYRAGLKESGYVDGYDVTIEYRWAEGHYDKLPALAADLVSRKVAVLSALGGEGSALAAKAATQTIPIVFNLSVDPVKLGLIENFNRPGGNVTGVMSLTSTLEGKRFGLLREIVPKADTIAILVNPTRLIADGQVSEARDAAASTGVRVVRINAASAEEFDAAFAMMVEHRAGGVLVAADPYFFSQHQRLVALAARHKLPAIYEWRDYPLAGGLMSYGTVLADAYRQNGIYAGRILKGERPADLPIVQSSKFEFVLNLKTAKALGLELPLQYVARADEIIE